MPPSTPVRPPGRQRPQRLQWLRQRRHSRQRRQHRLITVVTIAAAAALAATVAAPQALSATSAATLQDQTTTFFAWGTNYNGQIGDGTLTDAFTPQTISLPGGVAPVETAVGYQFDLALGADARIYSWGDDADRELGDAGSVARRTPQAIALPGDMPAISVAAGNNYGLAVGADNQVYWWGTQRGTGQGPQQLPTQVPLPGGDTARSVAVFNDETTALGVDGKLFVWGQNYQDSLGLGNSDYVLTPQQLILPGGDAAVSAAVGEGFGLAVGVDGKLFSWGQDGTDGVLGNGTTTPVPTPAQISLPNGVPTVSVAAGQGYAMALGADGHVYTWGRQRAGALGNNAPDYSVQLTPRAITLPGGALATSIASTADTNFALDQNGGLYAWGYNGFGQIGDGTTQTAQTPKTVAIPGGRPIGSVGAGVYVILAVPGSASTSQAPPQFLARPAPPLAAMTGAVYSAVFPAGGAPVYSLVGAPSWLSVTAGGAVTGTPPAGVSSFTYSVTAENAAGNAQIGPFTVTVAAAAQVAGTVLRNGTTTPVAGATVQACTTTTNQCRQTTTAADGGYSLAAPVGSSVVISVFPLPGSGGTTTATNPLAVPADGIQNEVVYVDGTATLPAGLQVDGTVGTPSINWSTPANLALAGCPDGLATASVIGQDYQSGTYDATITALTESATGSGGYTGVIPPLYPVHGPVEIDDAVMCPTVGPLIPAAGATGGGTTVLISGSGFTDATGVSFGTAPATAFTVLDDGGIQAVAPPGTGSVPVGVQVGGSTSAVGQYTYMQVSSITPTTGPRGGGTGVVITGTGLTNATEVFFGATAAAFTQVSDTRIDAVSPPGSGVQDVTVLTLGGETTAAVAADQFTYAGGGANSGTGVTRTASAHTSAHKPAHMALSGSSAIDETPALALAKPSPALAQPAAITAAESAQALQNLSVTSSLTQGLDWVNQYIPSIPGVPAYIKSLVQTAEFAVKPNCTTGKAAAAADMVLAMQPQIRALGATLAVGVEIGLPGFLTSIGVGVPAAAAIVAFFRTPTGQAALTLTTTAAAGWMALQAAKAAATVLFALYCPGSSPPANDAYIDPSGTVLDTDGNPVAGATVTILRADDAAGPYTALDPAGPGIMPAVNPETTGSDGVFHWDVYSGWYEVRATAPGCTPPGEPGESAATIGPYPVPPPQVGLTITLACTGQTGPPTPTVTSLSTGAGPAAGGTTLTVLGTGFTPASTVDFGTAAATAVTYLSGQALTVTSPAGGGAVDVTVKNATTSSATSDADRFVYGSPPTVTGLETSGGPVTGGTTVTIDGTGFTGASGVVFGSLPATSFTVESDTRIQATAPAAPSGTVDVFVAASAGTSTQSPADHYTYTAMPVVFTADTPPATATVGQPYTYTYAASGSPAPSYVLGSGSLPPGLSLNSATGVLSGTPTAAGVSTFTVVAANGAGTPATSPSTTISVGAPPSPAIDNQATVTGAGTVTADLTTTSAGDLIVAFVAADGPSGSAQKAKVSGGGLTWTLAVRANTQSGTAEIWTARATGALSHAAITSALTKAGYGQALTVLAFSNAPGTGQTASASKAKGAATAGLTTTTAGSWVFAVGNDWTASTPRTVGPDQTLLAQSTDDLGDTYWVQCLDNPTPAAGTTVTINDVAPTKDNWNLALVEID